LGLEDDALEREIENAMMEHITKFLLELGKWFAFVGRQYQLVVSENEYYIDLLLSGFEYTAYKIESLFKKKKKSSNILDFGK
jgi:predicted nuclease of restriction endonuclease-like (RecB) superfamily